MQSKYSLCLNILPSLFLKLNLILHELRVFLCGFGHFDKNGRVFNTFIVIFVECHVFTCKKTERSDWFHHMTPLPHPIPGKGKKADMLEGNVLVKKYGGGRQEVWRKVSHYFGFTFRQFVLP